MKKLAFIFSLLAVCGFMAGACGDDDNGGGPHCVDPPATCEPDCTLPEVCCGTECKNETCTPACATDGTEFCNPCDGTCVTLCVPACAAGQQCNNGTCEDIPDPPVCDPLCVAPQVCVD